MRTKISLPILCLCLGLSSAAFANDEHHPEKLRPQLRHPSSKVVESIRLSPMSLDSVCRSRK